MQDTRQLKRKFRRTLAAIVAALLACGAVTYAWYIFNSTRHITDVRMAAGTGVTFLISDAYDGDYRTSTGLTFQGLLNPVSTDNIANGFQRAELFTAEDASDEPQHAAPLLASVFAPAKRSDYYMESLYLTTNSTTPTDVYLAGIEFQEQDDQNPISTALRVGLVVHAAGEGQAEVSETVWQLSDAANPQAQYNTLKGADGTAYVLDSTKTDGSTVPEGELAGGGLHTSANYCSYNDETGEVRVGEGSTLVCTLPAAASIESGHGTPVQVDVYVWLEGCDPDCTSNLCETSLSSLALHFAGVRR